MKKAKYQGLDFYFIIWSPHKKRAIKQKPKLSEENWQRYFCAKNEKFSSNTLGKDTERGANDGELHIIQ